MSELRFEDILINAGTDEFDRMIGYAEFPYFHKQIEVVCEEGRQKKKGVSTASP